MAEENEVDINVHSDESEPIEFLCVNCPQSRGFRNAENLLAHSRGRHREYKFPFECKCGNVFITDASRDQHMVSDCPAILLAKAQEQQQQQQEPEGEAPQAPPHPDQQ